MSYKAGLSLYSTPLFRFLRTSFLIFSLFLFGCGVSQDERDAPNTDVRKEVEEMLHTYINQINEHGVKAEIYFLDSSDGFFWIPPGFDTAISYDSVMSILKAMGDENRNIFSWENLSVQAYSDTLATYAGSLKSIGKDSLGNEITTTLIETGAVIKRKDGWKLYNGKTTIAE